METNNNSVVKTSTPMELEVGEDISLWWPTPIYDRVLEGWKDVNLELISIIMEKKENDAGIQRSNIGGWHSDEQFFAWKNPAVEQVRRWVKAAFKEVTLLTTNGSGFSGQGNLLGWVNVSEMGDYNNVHIHPNCVWSGVYYVEVGTPSDKRPFSGQIYFLDPRSGSGYQIAPFNVFGNCKSIKPQNGQMLMFPSWLQHGVRPYDGEGERISIAFNILLPNPGMAASMPVVT